MYWSTLIDILNQICPNLTSLTLRNIPLEFVHLSSIANTADPLKETSLSPTKDVFPNITRLAIEKISMTIQQLIQFNNHFPNLENIYVHIQTDNTLDASSRIDHSAALSFKSVTLSGTSSSTLAKLLPLLPNMTRLEITDCYEYEEDDDYDVASVVAAFRALGNRNQFKELYSISVEWSVADFKNFLQLDCLRSLEHFEIWDSGMEFIEAIGDVAIEAAGGFILSSSVSTISVLSKMHFPVFTNTIRELRLGASSGTKSAILTSPKVLILKMLLNKMPCLKELMIENLLFPDLTFFYGIDYDTDEKEDGDSHSGNKVPHLRYFHGCVKVKTEPITPEMITKHILDRLAPDLEELKIVLVLSRFTMKEPWVNKLREWSKLVSNKKRLDLPRVTISFAMEESY
ncbi:hypothetical protein FBU30_002260 [Linnemannia zychae]|nr:hypothetical protein FBU30_002260 [Linnemannia zychae]